MAGGPRRGIRVPHPVTRGGRPPGHPLADGPVHGLPAVGRDLTAGCPALAGGVGPPRGLRLPPLDRAGVTAVLLELARLKGWNLAGLSMDYVKCFDIIPQAVLLRVARELGMDRGTLQALAAMYGQLRRAFRGALNVVLIDLLTSIWKMKINDMRKHVVGAAHAERGGHPALARVLSSWAWGTAW